MTNSMVHSYPNDFPADVLPRGAHLGMWSGHYVVLDGGSIHVPTDVALQGSAKVVVTVTDANVSIMLDFAH